MIKDCKVILQIGSLLYILGTAGCSTILQPQVRNFRLNSTIFDPRIVKYSSSSRKLSGHESGDAWSSEAIDNHVSPDFSAVANDQYPADSIKYSGYETGHAHSVVGYSHGKGYPATHGWGSHNTQNHGWDGWKHEEGWGNHAVHTGYETWSEYWTKMKSWFGAKSLFGSSFLLGFFQAFFFFLPITILVGLLIFYRNELTLPNFYNPFIGCVRSSSNELWKSTTKLTQRILSSNECVERIACEIDQASFVKTLADYLTTGLRKSKKLVSPANIGPYRNGTMIHSGRCERYLCDPIGGFKTLFN